MFGGNGRRVTIAGNSAGAGSVMYHALTRGGKEETALFQNVSVFTALMVMYSDLLTSIQGHCIIAVFASTEQVSSTFERHEDDKRTA